jgi:outer membrane protein assembly factor BamA
MGPFLDFRGANLSSVDGSDVPVPTYEAATTALGFCVFYDGRDNRLSPTSGVYDTFTLRAVPEGLSSYEDGRTFFQAEVDHRMFSVPIAGAVVGWRLYLAGSWGEPSYQYRYFLGGPYALRGYFTNRFRGDKVYAAQVEGRRDITRLWGSTVSLAAFLEIGEATDNWFGDPKASYGGGLRFTLPPDHVAKVRLDFAWADDQQSVYFIFGEAF